MKRIIKNILILNFYIIPVITVSYGQDDPLWSIGLWEINTVKGSFSVEGIYRTQKDILKDNNSSIMNTSMFRGNIKLSSNSYLWNPNFLSLDLDMEYTPNKYSENYIVVPLRSESNTTKRLYASTTIFNSLPVTISLFGNYSNSYTSRDFSNDIQYDQKILGGTLLLKNDFLPMNINYTNTKWSETEIKTANSFNYSSNNFSLGTKKDFGSISKNSFSFNHDDISTQNYESKILNNKITNAILNDRLTFDKDGSRNLSSVLSYYNSIGYQNFARIQEAIDLRYRLPEEFKLTAGYRYINNKRDILSTIQNNPTLMLENQLYLSLHTFAYLQYSDSKDNNIHESRNLAGLGFNYTKIIPFGIFYMNYEYNYQKNKTLSNNSPIYGRSEEYSLTDGKLTILRTPMIILSSLIVHDETFNVIYQKDIDYLLIQSGSFIQIQRIPGGKIQNNATIYVDYTANAVGSYTYNSATNSFDIKVDLFDNFIEFYFKIFENNISNVNIPDLQILKEIHQKLYGVQFLFGTLTIGSEFDNYNTNIIPYNSYKIYSKYTDNFFYHLQLSLSGNYQNLIYIMDNQRQKFADIAGRAEYFINDNTSLDFEGSFRYQSGQGLGLNLLNLKSELKYNFYKILVRFGYEGFFRNFIGSITNFHGMYLRIERKF